MTHLDGWRRRMPAFVMGATLVVAALAGCQPKGEPIRSPFDDRGPQPTVAPNVPNYPPPFLPPTSTPSPTASASATPTIGPGGDAEAATGAAIEALATRMGIAATRFTVDRVESVSWPDGCLGVSLPGIGCAQVVTPGYRVVLRANTGSRHEVHTGRGGATAWAPQATIHATVQQPGATLALVDAKGAKISALTSGGTQLVGVTLAALKAGDRVVLGADDLGDGSPLRVAWLARER